MADHLPLPFDLSDPGFDLLNSRLLNSLRRSTRLALARGMLTVRSMLSRILLVLIFASALVGFAGCKGKSGPLKVLHYGNGDEPQDLDSQTTTGVYEFHLSLALQEGLLSADPVTLEPSPGVAEKWEVSADGLTYTFHLRANALWSNKDPLTAKDFVRSYQRMLTASFAAEY